MYGLVNKAVEQMVCRAHGRAIWETIKTEAGVDVAGFISNEPYSDDITYALVGAASRVLKVPADEILKAFGEHWVLHTALESYGPLMRAAGDNLRDFLIHLPHFHTRVESIYPHLTPPEFSCSNISETGMELHYWTPRPAGLEPFVEGLLNGLGKMFETPVEVRLLKHRADGHDHSIFSVRWERAA